MIGSESRRRAPRRIGVGLAIAATLGLGGAGLAWASGSARPQDAAAEQARVCQVTNLEVPAVVLPDAKACAIVGAADGRYYLVRPDGTAVPVIEDRRRDLFWR